jgi:hypothetical protein
MPTARVLHRVAQKAASELLTQLLSAVQRAAAAGKAHRDVATA